MASPFVLDPNKLDGYPSINTLSDTGWTQYELTNEATTYVHGDFTSIGDTSIINGTPSYGEDLPDLEYGIVNGARQYVYGDFTSIGNINIINGTPSYGEDLPDQEYSIPQDSKVYVYGDFTKINSDTNDIKTPIFDSTPKEMVTFGAGFECEFLEEIEIPKSVMFIADYAFWNSNITHVKINRHCVYYDHSFPPGCHIKPYRDDE